MFSDKVTFVLFMYNEEKRVERAIRNFLSFGRVLIVDNYSSDQTVSIAQSMGASVVLHKNKGWVEDEETAAVVKSAVKTEWLYWGFSDEIVDYATMCAMLAAIDSGQYSIVNIARKNYYYGRFCHEAYQNSQSRAFKKNAIDFTGNVIHQFGKACVPDAEICYLSSSRYFIHHFISNNAKSYLASLDRYTDIEAEKAKPVCLIRMLLSMVRSFIGHYFLKGGYRSGRAGAYLAIQVSLYTFLLSVKAYERTKGLNVQSIEALNNQTRDHLLEEIKSHVLF